MEYLYPKTIEIHEPPKNLDKDDLEIFGHDYKKEFPATTLQVIKNANILKDTIFKFRFYERYTHLYKLLLRHKLKRLFLYLTNPAKVDKGIWIIDNWSYGYFHWFCDALPRLIACESHIKDHVVLLPIKYGNSIYVMQSLELLNYRIHFYDPKKRLKIKELLLPSHTAITGHYNHKIISKLRTKFLKGNEITSRKIYISRSKAYKRKVVNEAEILPILKEYGYEIHHFEDYNFLQQLQLMREATSLIGLHGAGLTNMLFMPPNGKILEFRIKESMYNNCYFMLASDLSHIYHYLICKADSDKIHDANLVVDKSKLAIVLKEIG